MKYSKGGRCFNLIHNSTHLSLQVCLVLLVESLEPLPVGPLGVSVDVHLDDAVGDGLTDLFLGRAGAAMHHKEGGLVLERGGIKYDSFPHMSC